MLNFLSRFTKQKAPKIISKTYDFFKALSSHKQDVWLSLSFLAADFLTIDFISLRGNFLLGSFTEGELVSTAVVLFISMNFLVCNENRK